MKTTRATSVLPVTAMLRVAAFLLLTAWITPESRAQLSDAPEEGDRFGAALATGDFDGDGLADLAVGVPGENADENGAIQIIYGSAVGLSNRDQFLPTDNRSIGSAIAAGDFNNDGFDDLALGSPKVDARGFVDAGRIYVLYGSSSGIDTSTYTFFDQDTEGVPGVAETQDLFGFAVESGDFDGDGFADLAIGAPGESVGSILFAGAFFVLYGSANGLTSEGSQIFHQNSNGVPDAAEEGDLFGIVLAAGDINADGADDLVVGAPSEDLAASLPNAGQITVFYGSTSGLTPSGSAVYDLDLASVPGDPAPNDQFGYSLALGDFDGNGAADVAVGVIGKAVASVSRAGAVYVFYGGTAGLSTAIQVFDENDNLAGALPETDDQFGAALTAADFNGDGRSDLAIGSPSEDTGAIEDCGSFWVLYGSAGSVPGLSTIDNSSFDQSTGDFPDACEAFDGFGVMLAAGDFNGNGRKDLAVAAPLEDIGSILNAGAVGVYYSSLGYISTEGSLFIYQGTTLPQSNQAPVAETDEVTTTIATPIDIDVLANDTDPDGDPLLVAALTEAPSSGTATIINNGQAVRYTPNDNVFFTQDSFRYQVSDQKGGLAEGLVLVTVQPGNPPDTEVLCDWEDNGTCWSWDFVTGASTFEIVNNPAPDAVNASAKVQQFTVDTSAPYPLFIHDYATPVDFISWPTYTLKVYTEVTGASILLKFENADVSFSQEIERTVTPGSWQELTFQFAPMPGDPLVRMVIFPSYSPAGMPQAGTWYFDDLVRSRIGNAPPAIADDQATTTAGNPIDIDVLANDTDPDGDPLIVSAIIAQPANGTATIINNGQAVRYTPNAGFAGQDDFRYQASDQKGAPVEGTVIVTVTEQPTAQAQLINAVATSSPVDIVLSNPTNQQVTQSLNFREATPLGFAVPAGNVTIEARRASATIASTTTTLEAGTSYVIVAGGTISNGTIMVTEAMAQAPNNEIRTSFVNAVAGSPGGGLDVNLLNDSNPPQIEQSLAANVGFGASPTPYVQLPERNMNIQVANGGNEIGVFRFLLNGRPGEAFVGVLSGPNADASLVLDLYRTNGERLGDTVTASESEADVPDAFALRGNYPNPFNPTTTSRFVLREAATVHVDIIDVLGRVVMTVPERSYASGANQSLEIEAASLPSGMYLYRVVAEMEAETSIRTGRMMLVK